MGQLETRWIADGAVTSSKLDSSSSFTVAGLTNTGNTIIAGDMTVLGNALINGVSSENGDIDASSLTLTQNLSVGGNTYIAGNVYIDGELDADVVVKTDILTYDPDLTIKKSGTDTTALYISASGDATISNRSYFNGDMSTADGKVLDIGGINVHGESTGINIRGGDSLLVLDSTTGNPANGVGLRIGVDSNPLINSFVRFRPTFDASGIGFTGQNDNVALFIAANGVDTTAKTAFTVENRTASNSTGLLNIIGGDSGYSTINFGDSVKQRSYITHVHGNDHLSIVVPETFHVHAQGDYRMAIDGTYARFQGNDTSAPKLRLVRTANTISIDDVVGELQFDAADSGSTESIVDAMGIIRVINKATPSITNSNRQSDMAFLVKAISGDYDAVDIEVLRLTYFGDASVVNDIRIGADASITGNLYAQNNINTQYIASENLTTSPDPTGRFKNIDGAMTIYGNYIKLRDNANTHKASVGYDATTDRAYLTSSPGGKVTLGTNGQVTTNHLVVGEAGVVGIGLDPTSIADPAALNLKKYHPTSSHFLSKGLTDSDSVIYSLDNTGNMYVGGDSTFLRAINVYDNVVLQGLSRYLGTAFGNNDVITVGSRNTRFTNSADCYIDLNTNGFPHDVGFSFVDNAGTAIRTSSYGLNISLNRDTTVGGGLRVTAGTLLEGDLKTGTIRGNTGLLIYAGNPDTTAVMSCDAERVAMSVPLRAVNFTDTDQSNFGSPADGYIIYNTTKNKLRVSTLGSWADLH